jgi:hypothetical protein
MRTISAKPIRSHSTHRSASADLPRSHQSIDLLRELAADKPVRRSCQGRAALKQRLAQVEDQIALGRQQFAQQLMLVAEIERKHADSAAARETLQLFAQAHVIRLDDRDRLARLLEQA